MTTTQGIEAVFVTTHNWGTAARFFQALGFELEFETDHNSGQLRNGDGPYVFIAEVPEHEELGVQLVLGVADADGFRPDPALDVVSGFADTHYGTQGDGRAGSRRTARGASRRRLHARSCVVSTAPDNTAVRTALWRAMHVLVDEPPHVLDDVLGLQLVAPDADWRDRPDMHPDGTRGFRASIVARARFVEDLVTEQADRGVDQYVILGAGLDTLAERRPDLAARLRIFEVDQPADAGVEAGPAGGDRHRRPDVAAAGADRLRERRQLVGRVAGGRLRSRPARRRGIHRRQHVPDQGRHGRRCSGSSPRSPPARRS